MPSETTMCVLYSQTLAFASHRVAPDLVRNTNCRHRKLMTPMWCSRDAIWVSKTGSEPKRPVLEFPLECWANASTFFCGMLCNLVEFTVHAWGRHASNEKAISNDIGWLGQVIQVGPVYELPTTGRYMVSQAAPKEKIRASMGLRLKSGASMEMRIYRIRCARDGWKEIRHRDKWQLVSFLSPHYQKGSFCFARHPVGRFILLRAAEAATDNAPPPHWYITGLWGRQLNVARCGIVVRRATIPHDMVLAACSLLSTKARKKAIED